MLKKQLLMLMLVAGLTGTFAYAVSAVDSQFMRKAAEGGMAEVELGKLASDKGSNDAVKDLGNTWSTTIPKSTMK